MSEEVKKEKSENSIIIQGPEYIMKNSGNSWDLYFLKVVNKGKEDQKYEFKPAGFGLRFETCIKDIITYRTKLRSKQSSKEGDVELKRLMKVWMEEKAKLLSVLELDDDEWSNLSCLKRIPMDKLKQRDLVDAEVTNPIEEDDEEEINED